MLLVVFLLLLGGASVCLVLGVRAAPGEREGGWCEDIAAVGLAMIVLATALSWGLMAVQQLRAVWLMVGAAAMFVAALAAYRRVVLARLRVQIQIDRATAWSLLALLVLIAWWGYAAWRGTVVPITDSDANCYHMPKALFIAQSGGYGFFDGADLRTAAYPANFEVLEAVALLLTGTDQYSFVLPLALSAWTLVLVAALMRRWWGTGVHQVVAVLLVGSMPIFLMHVALEKNDMMLAGLALASALWVPSWATSGGRFDRLAAIASVACMVGTKPTGLFTGVVAIGLIVWRAVRVW